MPDPGVTGKRVVVVGGQASGSAAARLLVHHGARVILSDAATQVPDQEALGRLGVEFELGGNRPETLASADLIVLSPGVPVDQPAVRAAARRGVPVIGEIELAWRALSGRVIAVTGTKGKSTTTTIIGRMLQSAGLPARVSGNIGSPLSAEAVSSTRETIHVVEVSSFQLETTVSFRPWIAVLLNLSPDHLDRHPDFAAYAAAKARIFANQGHGDWVVVNVDDAEAMAMASRGAARVRGFSAGHPVVDGVGVDEGAIVRRSASGRLRLIPLAEVRVPGRHLLADVTAAAAVADLAGVGPEHMVAAVSSFRGLEHAMEVVAELAGVRFVNDSKATNVESARQSVLSFEAPLVPILGGVFKGGDLGPLREAVAGRARMAVLIGSSRERFREALEGAVPLREVETIDEAVREAFEAARPDGTVLLAPACASFDMFDNYAQRGRAFKSAVERLRMEEGSSS